MLTEKAANKVKEISEAEGIGHCNIRVKVIGGGCAGFTHDLYFEDQISEMDEVFEQDGVKIVCDPLSYQYLDETGIDYLDTEMGGGFKFMNPNVKGSCGCGSSVKF
ncbi:MAG TPA: iron-sulfur cluster assembly accessory protein [Cytophagaceae bacterium]|nr:iron-sulfur cluster assembly accessory protein [Cytophagaceae bacterium]